MHFKINLFISTKKKIGLKKSNFELDYIESMDYLGENEHGNNIFFQSMNRVQHLFI